VSPNGKKCRSWTNVWTTGSVGTRNLPTESVPESMNDVYWLSNAQNTKGLYIYDPSPTWHGNPYWTTSASSKIVRCRTSQQRDWSRGLEKQMSCNEDGVGQNACGHINGWILWHDGATFSSNHHPCPVSGSTHIGRGDLTKLWICSSLNPPLNPPGDTVSSPDGRKCNSWTHVWSDMTGTRNLPTTLKNSINDVYWFSNPANSKGLYIYDPSPKFTGLHYWETRANAGVVRCRSSEQGYWSRGLEKQMNCNHDGVGQHKCGSNNGWILWHNGATYFTDVHPCPVAGSTHSSQGDLTELWVCSSLAPPGDQVSPNGKKCRSWTNVWTTGSVGTRNLPTESVPESMNDVYWLSNAQNTKGLYIYDPSPTWHGNPYWTTSASSKIVRCRTSQQRDWSRGLEKQMSCNEDGVGQNACGHINGWILWHDGATFSSNHHPCPVSGSTHIGRGDLTKLWICSSLNPPLNPPGDTVSSPDGRKCNSWTHVWSDMTGTRNLPTTLKNSINDVYWFSNPANSKGLYIYDPSPKFTGLHYWETRANAGVVRCRSSEQGYWSRGLEKQMNCNHDGVGQHKCGSGNGWILWHNGATYFTDAHPCPVAGSTHGSQGDLTELWICSSLKYDELAARIEALEMKISSMEEKILEKLSQNMG